MHYQRSVQKVYVTLYHEKTCPETKIMEQALYTHDKGAPSSLYDVPCTSKEHMNLSTENFKA